MFNTRKLKFQENISGAQITCHAQPDSNMKPEMGREKFVKFNNNNDNNKKWKENSFDFNSLPVYISYRQGRSKSVSSFEQTFSFFESKSKWKIYLPIIKTECINKIPFLDEGAEYDNAKQKLASWKSMCCGCCHRHNAVLPVTWSRNLQRRFDQIRANSTTANWIVTWDKV